MYLEFSDEQKEIQQLARKFTLEEIIPKAAEHDQTGEVCMQVHIFHIQYAPPGFQTFFVLLITSCLVSKVFAD